MAVAVSRPAPWQQVNKPVNFPQDLFGHELIITCGIAQNIMGPPMLVKYFKSRNEKRRRWSVVTGMSDIKTNEADDKTLALHARDKQVKYIMNIKFERNIRGPSTILHKPA